MKLSGLEDEGLEVSEMLCPTFEEKIFLRKKTHFIAYKSSTAQNPPAPDLRRKYSTPLQW
jgi:hypothetical protein